MNNPCEVHELCAFFCFSGKTRACARGRWPWMWQTSSFPAPCLWRPLCLTVTSTTFTPSPNASWMSWARKRHSPLPVTAATRPSCPSFWAVWQRWPWSICAFAKGRQRRRWSWGCWASRHTRCTWPCWSLWWPAGWRLGKGDAEVLLHVCVEWCLPPLG